MIARDGWGGRFDARASALRPVVVVGLLGEAALVVLVVIAAAS